MARLVTIAIFLFFIFIVLLLLILKDENTIFLVIGLMASTFGVFIYIVYIGASRIQKELTMINKYLSSLDKIDKIDYKVRFFSKEFDDIGQSLIGVLKASKKRENIKQRYNAKLKLKNRQRGDMISAIAHEFRNPIASIMGYAQTLEDDKDIPLGLQDKFLHKIYSNGLKIESLLSRLVLWNKFESGEATLHLGSFDIYVLVQDVKVTIEEKYTNRTINIEGENYKVYADRTLIDIVLKNLIENALKYSKDEITIIIDSNKISVIDKGAGISSSDINKVTKKFYRSGLHTWDNSMGLGLSIVKNILALHGTKLDIKSEENKGSIFSFTI